MKTRPAFAARAISAATITRALAVVATGALAVGAGAALTGCLYTDVRAPLSYGSATPGDAGGNLGDEVTGSACNTAILWLVAFGDGGYDAAVRDAKKASQAPFLVDVKADTTYTNVLFGLYQHQCTAITARVPAAVAAGGQGASPSASSSPSPSTGGSAHP